MKKLEQRIHDDKNGLDYVLVGDYYIPVICADECLGKPIGRWGRMHMQFIKEYKSAFYNELVLSCKLVSYLTELDEQAQERYELIVKQIAEKSGITEKLKAENQMEWVRQMNGVRIIAEEIVCNEMIYC